MKRINGDSLRPGDVVLTTTRHMSSKSVRVITQSDISHAMLCVSPFSVIDATDAGVQARNTQRLMFEDDCAIYVMRLRRPLTETELSGLIMYARSIIGTEYVSVKELSRVIRKPSEEFSRKQFCSRLVAQAYASAGIKLFENENFCSPEDLKTSSSLKQIEQSSESVSDEEVEFWKNWPDVNDLTRKATNSILDGLRTKVKNIHDLNDVARHLVRHPEDDHFVLNLYISSGYLVIWRIQREQSPWQYDLKLLNESKGHGAVDYCFATVNGEKAGPNRYTVNRAFYADLVKRTGLLTFKTEARLYRILDALHKRRVWVATQWLAARGLLPS